MRQVGRIELTGEQAFIFDTFTRKQPVVIEDEPEAHFVWLDVGPSHFRIGEPMENPELADWMRAMLAKALCDLVYRSMAAARAMDDEGDQQ